MCDPFTAALLVGGTVASVAGKSIATSESNKQMAAIVKARNKVLNDTLEKNKVYADRSRQVFDERVGDISTDASMDIANAQNQHASNIEANIPAAAPVESGGLPASSPKVVKSALAKKLSDIFSESTAQAKRTGALTGYGGFFQDQAIADAGANRDVGVNADMISGNMRLMPALQDYAEIGATKPSSGLGQILSALGGMASSAAGARGGLSIPGFGGEDGGFLRPNLKLLNKNTGMFGGGV